MQVIERLAYPARVAYGFGLRQGFLPVQQVGQRLSVEKFHHQIRPALLLLNLDYLEHARVQEPRADLLLALESFETRNIAFERHQRHLDRNCFAGLAVPRLEDRRHIAARDQIGDFKAGVERHARGQFPRG